jgi:hypothetical protein
LQSLDASDLFLLPDLGVVRTAQSPPSPVEPYEFTIGVSLRPAVSDEDEDYTDSVMEGGAG